MKASFFEQAAKLLKDRSKRSRWLSVVLCLALIVSAGTFYTFMRQGQAKVYKEKVLVCHFSAHEHDETCYDEDGTLLCGLADYVLHTHNDDCYNADGDLVCELGELKYHEHDESCYAHKEVLICDHEELEVPEGGHIHTDECYADPETETEDDTDSVTDTAAGTEPADVEACQLEEHVHTAACYAQPEPVEAPEPEEPEEVLTCTEEEHSHDDGCYTVTVEEELVCGLEDDEEHVHDDGCYVKNEIQELTCALEEHSHGGDCYETVQPEPVEVPEPAGEAELICGLEEHTHDTSCTPVAEAEPTPDPEPEATPEPDSDGEADEDGRVLICGLEETEVESIHTAECYKTELVLTCEEEELFELHTHDEDCYDADGNVICGELEVQEHVHGPECFVEITVNPDDPDWTCGKIAHTHEESCYDADGNAICGLEEHEHTEEECLTKEEPKWLCGKIAHTHDKETCCDADGNLICELEEHTHTGECLIAPEPEWLCGKEAHTHTELCFNPFDLDGEPICGQEEHEHSEACLAVPELKWLCGKTAHTHGEDCRDENGELICTLEEHEHTAECLDGLDPDVVCGKIAHTHEDSCYDADGNVICGLEEHTHTEECLAKKAVNWLCGLVEHTHDGSCYDINGDLICGLEEHTHTDACLALMEIVPVAEDYNYTTDRGWFDIVLHIEGEGLLPVQATEPDPDAGIDPLSEDETLPEPAPEPETEPVPDAGADRTLTVAVEPRVEGDPEYDLFAAQAAELEEMLLDVLSIQVDCDGQELDISKCKITAAITPTELFKEAMAAMTSATFADEPAETDGETPAETQDTVLRLTAYEAAATEPASGETEAVPDAVNTLDSIFIDPNGETDASVASVDGAEPDADASADEPAADEPTAPVDAPTADEPTADGGETVDVDPDMAVEPTAEPGTLVVMLSMQRSNDVMALTAAQSVNTPFTVQYYAYIDRLITEKNGVTNFPYSGATDGAKVHVIDTSGGVLPKNLDRAGTPQMFFFTDGSGNVQRHENALTELFKSRTFSYFTTDGAKFTYYDIMPKKENTENNHYELKALWILKPNATGVDQKEWEADENNWTKYEDLSTLRFTNSSETHNADNTYILITSDTVIRMIYDETEGSYTNGVAFYDYDISDGKIYTQQSLANPKETSEQSDLEQAGNKIYAYTNRQGINNVGNYSAAGSLLGFGNSEGVAKTGLGGQQWYDPTIGKNVNINQANGDSYGKCTFGLVTGLVDKQIQYAPGIVAPDLFNEDFLKDNKDKATGKAGFSGSLHFDRNGDTYVLSAVTGGHSMQTGLDLLTYSGIAWGTNTGSIPRYDMYTNHFWPMNASDTWGTDGHDMKFGDAKHFFPDPPYKKADGNRFNFSGDGDNYSQQPKADNDKDNNAYFGMNFAVDFTLTEDYCGPLEYLFYGDDDMWVFLSNDGGATGQLVCDIGGVHQSVGEYVNLWDYLTEEKEVTHEDGTVTKEKQIKPGSYSLYFFYTERGASGSTCWMQFTLPQASARPVDVTSAKVTNTLHVSKEVSGGDADLKDKEFMFQIFLTDKDGNETTDAYSYTRYNEHDEAVYENEVNKVIHSGGTFILKHKEYIQIDYLPPGGKYEIKELGMVTPTGLSEMDEKESVLTVDGPRVSVDGFVAGGTLGEGNNSSITEIELVNRYFHKLPETGGIGYGNYAIVGALMAVAGCTALVGKRKKEN